MTHKELMPWCTGMAVFGPMLLARAAVASVPAPAARPCPEPYQVTREEILQAMRGHGAYSLTSTNTSMRFGAEALLAIAHRRQREAPENTRFVIRQDDWFVAHRETAGVTYAKMSEAARAGFEHHQDAVVDFGPQVVQQVLEGPAPVMALEVTIFWPDSGNAPSEFHYRDTLSVPRVDVYDHHVIRFKLLEYPDMLVFDQVEGISVRPKGFLSAVFTVFGKPDLKETRLAVSADQWEVVRGRVKVFPGISKTGTATIEPNGRGHEGVPRGRVDLKALQRLLERPLKLRYGAPSCEVA